MRTSYYLKLFCATLFHGGHYMENSLRFEISLLSNWQKWILNRSEFQPTWTHVNTINEVTLHRYEILPQSEISN